jgi:hypothetical protein
MDHTGSFACEFWDVDFIVPNETAVFPSTQ